MPLLLRKVSLSRWKLPGDPCSDALRCLATDEGNLSLWSVQDDHANLNAIVTALAAKCEHLCKIDYYMVPQSHIEGLGIRLQPADGDTPARGANQWHVDAKELTAHKLAEIASAMYTNGTSGRKTLSAIKTLLKDALVANSLDKEAMVPSLLKQLAKS